MFKPFLSSSTPFIIPIFDDNDSECHLEDDPLVFYTDIQQSLNDDSKYKMKKRKDYIKQSKIKSKNRLTEVYQKKLDKLSIDQEQQILSLRNEWDEARCKAYLEDISNDIQDQKTKQLLSLCGKYSEAERVQRPQNNRVNISRCDRKYSNLFEIMKNRHQYEINSLTNSFMNELSLSHSEHQILSGQIENHYQTEIADNVADVMNIIATSERPTQVKQRLIRTVSPLKRKRLQFHDNAIQYACTPIPTKRFK